MNKKYIVSWKYVADGDEPGYQSGVIDEEEKKRLVTSLESDSSVYDIDIEEIENE